MPATTVPALEPVPQQWYNELEEKILVPMKLAEFIDSKLAGWDEYLKVKAALIRN